jgi:superfamily II DNA or RNA helicase
MWQELHAGQRVLARDEPWRVVALKAWNDCAEVQLASISPGNDGQERVLLLPFDRLEPLDKGRTAVGAVNRSELAWRRVSRRKWMRLLAAAAGATRPACGLQATHRAAIDLLPWQLEPAMALASGAASRVLIADAVGAGKTVQASAALVELQSRGEADRVLIVTPAGLRDQWAGELATRFGQTCLLADAAFLASAVQELPSDVNPWSLPGVYVVSFDFLKRPEVLHGIEGLWWDLVIADEAHLAAPGTDRGAALDRAAGRAARVILLTATPYASDREGYAALLATGRGRSSPPLEQELIVFRRARASLAIGVPDRRTRLLRIRLTAEERHLHRLLDRYTSRVWRENASAAARLAMIVLRKRALSSAWAVGRTIERRLALLEQSDNHLDTQVALPFDHDQEGEASTDDTVSDVVIGAPGLTDSRSERDTLTTLAAAAAACAGRESKVRSLNRMLSRTGDPAIVFTEYRDTLDYLSRQLASTRPHALLYGGLSREERRTACAALNDKSISLLLATDAAGEGLNLHFACRWVVNFELPWNPARLEQRAGRVDRYGQRRRPHVVHLVARGTAESIVLSRLEARLRRARCAGWFEGVWPTEPVVAAAVMGDAELPEVEVAPTAEALAAPRDVAALAERACSEAVAVKSVRVVPPRPADDINGSLSRGPLLLEVRPSRLARPRNGFDRLVAGSRSLFIFRSTISDGAGRVVDSTIAGAGNQDVAETCFASRLREVQKFRQLAAGRLAARWRTVGSTNIPERCEVQPALFDRRAINLAQAYDTARTALERDLTSRIDRLQRSQTLIQEPPELLLVARAGSRTGHRTGRRPSEERR